MVKQTVTNKKLKTLIIAMIILFIIFIIFLIMPKNYTLEYKIKNVLIKETYNKKDKNYYFTFTYNNQTLDYLIESNHKQKRKLIEDLNLIKDDNNFCLTPSSKTLDFIPLCSNNKTNIYYNLSPLNKKLNIKKNEPKLLKTYKDIEIYNQNYNYFLWNYDGIIYLSKEENKKIDIFNKELYNTNLITYTKNYLVIPNYDSNYTFNKYYTIEYKTGKLKHHNLKYDIYFDSYYLGYLKNKLYIIDNKEETMYEFNAKNGEIYKIKPKILNHNEWQKVNIKTLINKNKKFTYKTNYEYTLKDHNIYLNYYNKKIKTLIAQDITDIVRIKDQDIFYLKNDSLYHFNLTTQEEKLLTYFEWNFNYNNMIYLD